MAVDFPEATLPKVESNLQVLGKRRNSGTVAVGDAPRPAFHGERRCPVDLTTLLERYIEEHTTDEGCGVENSRHEAVEGSDSFRTWEELKPFWSLCKDRQPCVQ